MTNRLRTTLTCLTFTLVALPAPAAAQSRLPLEHAVYEVWDTIGGATLSRDGRWVHYTRHRYDRDDALVVRATAGEAQHVFERATGASISDASTHVVFRLQPARDSVLEARRERRPAAQMPPDTLAILDLATGQVTRIPGVRGFRVADGPGGWLAYLPPRPAGGQGAAAAGPGTRRGDTGAPLVLRQLATVSSCGSCPAARRHRC